MARTMATQEQALAVKAKYESYYRKLEGVQGMGFDGTSLIIYVDRLTPQLSSFLPTELENIPVRIIQTGGKIVPMM